MQKSAILAGSIISLALTSLGLIFAAWWVLTVWEPEMYLAGYLLFLRLISLASGGLLAGWKAVSSGWTQGGGVGFIYFAILLFGANFLLPGFFTWWMGLKGFILYVGVGSMCGVMGLNLKRAHRRRKKALKNQVSPLR